MENENNILPGFFDINSPLFAETNIHKVYRLAKQKSISDPASIAEIKQLQSRIEAVSKMKERRITRGLKRKISTRPWLSWSPRNLILSDLAFLRRVNVPIGEKNTHRVLFLAMDHFSRYASPRTPIIPTILPLKTEYLHNTPLQKILSQVSFPQISTK